MASVALMVGSFPSMGVLRSHRASSVMIAMVKLEAPAPGVMNPGGTVPSAVKPRGLRLTGVGAAGAEGAMIEVL